MLVFSDGVRFDTSGPLRIESRHDGLYVVGGGALIPVVTEEEAQAVLADMQARREPRMRSKLT